MAEVKADRWGYQMNTSSDACVSAINAYYHQVTLSLSPSLSLLTICPDLFHHHHLLLLLLLLLLPWKLLSFGRNRDVILEAPTHDHCCVLANVLAADFLRSSDSSQAQFHLQAAQSRLMEATSYEKAVFDAVSSLIAEDSDEDVALGLHFKLLTDFPRDLVSLKRAQILCFYMGRPDLSLKFVQQALPENKQESYIYGMLAFPLLELGHMADAEAAATKGVEINVQDCWSQHCLCHVFQYECRFKEAVKFMKECSPSWSHCSSFMYTHNWWHVALCYLEGHSSIGKVLELYDQYIWKELEKTDAVGAEVYINALGLLMRLYLRGEADASEDRLNVIVGVLTNQESWYNEWLLDFLIIWALASAGEFTTAEDLIRGLKMRISCMNKKKQQLMQRAIVLAEALYEYCRGNHVEALELLGPDFDARDYKIIGASDEQLDVFNELWYNILLNTGQAAKAIDVIKKRVAEREGVPFLWQLLERCYSMMGREEEAKQAGAKARSLEAAYFT